MDNKEFGKDMEERTKQFAIAIFKLQRNRYINTYTPITPDTLVTPSTSVTSVTPSTSDTLGTLSTFKYFSH